MLTGGYKKNRFCSPAVLWKNSREEYVCAKYNIFQSERIYCMIYDAFSDKEYLDLGGRGNTEGAE
jgi:hypothetical protein